MYVRRSIICCQHYSTGMVTTVVQALSASVSTGTTTSTSLPPQQQELEQQPEQEQEVIDIDEDDDADSIDEDQLTEFREQLISLGSFPDKVIINTLSMIAEDYKDVVGSATKLYQILRQRLLTCKASEKLPVIYVLDSVLKNCKGCYVPIVEQDAATWMTVVYQQLDTMGQAKLQKVWRTWNEFQLFASVTNWKAMGRCFTETNAAVALSSTSSSSTTPFPAVAGIARRKDGTLILSPSLRREMQNILDDMQSDVANELEKVSLERLADINPDLLLNIKSAAQDSAGISSSRNAAKMMQSNGSAKNGDNNDDSPPLPIFLTETRSPAVVARSDAWYQFWQKQQSEPTSVEAQAAHVTAALQQLVTAGTADDAITHTQKDALQMTHYLATCLAVSQLLSVTQARVHRQSSSLRSTTAAGVRHSDLRGRPDSANQNPNGTTGHHRTLLAVVDPVDFTSEGIKRPNLATISLLYEMGLPFQSSADGRRFRTQLQLSHHLDFLFQKNQLEKTMAVTEERGWYVADPVWTREQMPSDLDRTKSNADTTKPVDEDDPNAKTFPADENRDCCVVCGIHFKMFFDNDDDGVYKYSNCLEIAVLNDDDVAERESEPQLVHATCWNGLGQPAVLTVDQTLQETVRHQQQRTS